MAISKSSFSSFSTEILYNQRTLKLEHLQQQTSMDKDGRLWTTDRNLGSDRPSDGQMRTPGQDNNFKVNERTNF